MLEYIIKEEVNRDFEFRYFNNSNNQYSEDEIEKYLKEIIKILKNRDTLDENFSEDIDNIRNEIITEAKDSAFNSNHKLRFIEERIKSHF